MSPLKKTKGNLHNDETTKQTDTTNGFGKTDEQDRPRNWAKARRKSPERFAPTKWISELAKRDQ